jgi:hypothetical protein
MLNGLFLFTLGLLAYGGAIGFGMVWLRHQISVTANANSALDERIIRLEREFESVAAEVSTARSPERLLRKNEEFGLGLVRPREEQVRRVQVDVERQLAARRFDRTFAAGHEGVAGEAREAWQR